MTKLYIFFCTTVEEVPSQAGLSLAEPVKGTDFAITTKLYIAFFCTTVEEVPLVKKDCLY